MPGYITSRHPVACRLYWVHSRVSTQPSQKWGLQSHVFLTCLVQCSVALIEWYGFQAMSPSLGEMAEVVHSGRSRPPLLRVRLHSDMRGSTSMKKFRLGQSGPASRGRCQISGLHPHFLHAEWAHAILHLWSCHFSSGNISLPECMTWGHLAAMCTPSSATVGRARYINREASPPELPMR